MIPENAFLDRVHNKLLSNNTFEGMEELITGLFNIRNNSTKEEWKHYIINYCLNHPIKNILEQDPFTKRAFDRPKGYPGDAELIDHIY